MTYKKPTVLFITLFVSFSIAYADSFTDIIQDLAIQTACIGQYSATQAGGGWYDDPHDYYTPQMMAERFKNMSGNMTRTTTFYGVCFDYAQSAFDDIKSYRNLYNEQGMYEGQFWVVIVHENPNQIELVSIGTDSDYTRKSNGVPIKTYPTSNYAVKVHKHLDGTRATHHAWLWIMRNDGVWFWIDPTWTDNLGYVVYGYVKNGEEIQCRPDEQFDSPLLASHPAYLNRLPLPPAMGKRKAPSKTANSTNRAETINSVDTSYSSLAGACFSFGYTGSIPVGGTSESNFFNFNKFGLEVSSETWADKSGDLFAILALDYLLDYSDEKSVDSVLIGFDFGYFISSFFQPYLGGSLGIKWTDNFSWGNLGFAWKVNGGIRIPLSSLAVRADVSYGTILGLAGTIAVGKHF